MLEDVVLRIKDRSIFTSKPEFSHVILSQDWDQWPCGTPLVVDRRHIESAAPGSSTRVFALFPPRSFINSMEDFAVAKEGLADTSLVPLIKTHRTLSIDAFDYAKFSRLKDYVRDMGGITFVVKENAARKDLVNVLKLFPKEFRYTSLFHYARYNEKYLVGEDDDLLGVISFFNLPYCIPLFNLKKVDGMGVSYCQAPRKVSEKTNRLERSYRVDVVLSNYADNVFVIDGSDVNPLSPVHKDVYNELGEWVREEMKTRSKMPASDHGRSREEKLHAAKEIYISAEPSWNTTSVTYNSSATARSSSDS